jgi:hypothetical protein
VGQRQTRLLEKSLQKYSVLLFVLDECYHSLGWRLLGYFGFELFINCDFLWLNVLLNIFSTLRDILIDTTQFHFIIEKHDALESNFENDLSLLERFGVLLVEVPVPDNR